MNPESSLISGVNVAGDYDIVNIGCAKWWKHCNPDITIT